MPVRVPLAPAALVLVDIGGAVPYGLHSLGRYDPNATEIVVSVCFAVVALGALASLAGRRRVPLDEVAYLSGALWAVTAAYAAIAPGLTGLARLGLGMTFAGIAVGCWAWWQVLRRVGP